MANNNTGGFVNGLRPTTRKPRDGRASPLVNTMARTQADAPARSGGGGSAPVVTTSPVAVRTSKQRKGAKEYGRY